jgi:hypothetical protein
MLKAKSSHRFSPSLWSTAAAHPYPRVFQRDAKKSQKAIGKEPMAKTIEKAKAKEVKPLSFASPFAMPGDEDVTPVIENLHKQEDSQLNRCKVGFLETVRNIEKLQLAEQKRTNSRNDSDAIRMNQIKEMQMKLEEMHGGPLLDAGHFQKAMEKHLDYSCFRPVDLPTITKNYEEQNMYMADERTERRPCVNGLKCACYQTAIEKGIPPFVMQEFLYPEQLHAYKETKELPAMCGECLMCIRYEATLAYIQLKLAGADAKVMIVPHWNRCDALGEYNPDVCLLPHGNRFMGIAAPFVVFDQDIYVYVIDEQDPTKSRVTHADVANFRVASTA